MSKLEEILRAEAEAEIAEILAEADSRVEKMVSEAKGRAAALVAARRKRLEAAERVARQRARGEAEHRVAVARLQAKAEVMASVRQKVLAVLEEAPSQPDYGRVLQALAQEAAQVAEMAQTVVVHPAHREKLLDWAQSRGLEVQTDPDLRLGVRIVARGGKRVENTLPDRLERSWETLSARVSRLLWE